MRCEWVDEVDRVGDPLHDAELTDATELVAQLWWQAHQAILADWHNLHTVGKLAVVCIAVNVLRDHRLGHLRAAGHCGRQEINHLPGLTFVGIEEIDAFMVGFYSQG